MLNLQEFNGFSLKIETWNQKRQNKSRKQRRILETGLFACDCHSSTVQGHQQNDDTARSSWLAPTHCTNKLTFFESACVCKWAMIDYLLNLSTDKHLTRKACDSPPSPLKVWNMKLTTTCFQFCMSMHTWVCVNTGGTDMFFRSLKTRSLNHWSVA